MRRVIYWVVLIFCFFEASMPALAAGECDGRAQPITVSIFKTGEFFIQETKVASYREMNEKLAAMGFADCMHIRMDEETPWHVATEILFPLGVIGDFRTGSIMHFGGEDYRHFILVWVTRGYQGKITL